jgi:hypothetical protein
MPARIPVLLLTFVCLSAAVRAQADTDPRAAEILQKAIAQLGGERYLNVKTQIGRGQFSIFTGGVVASFQTFYDVFVFPDRERTEFKSGKVRFVQVNVGDTGWVYDGEQDRIKDQTAEQIAAFRRSIRVSLDNLLRRGWAGKARLEYVGRRPASLGRRNDVLRLVYADGFAVEFEFDESGLPQKAVYIRKNGDEEIREEDRYAQWVDIGGIKTPFIIDRISGGLQSSRINYESVEFDKSVPDSIFSKPAGVKDLKKSLRL